MLAVRVTMLGKSCSGVRLTGAALRALHEAVEAVAQFQDLAADVDGHSGGGDTALEGLERVVQVADLGREAATERAEVVGGFVPGARTVVMGAADWAGRPVAGEPPLRAELRAGVPDGRHEVLETVEDRVE